MKKSIFFESLLILFLILLIPISSAIEIHISNKTNINNSSDSHINTLKQKVHEKK